jgi:S1-C subfamily serine protease
VLGLQVGDEIVAVNGERVRTVQDVADRFGAVPPNVPVEVTITRNGEEQKLTGGPWFFAD